MGEIIMISWFSSCQSFS